MGSVAEGYFDSDAARQLRKLKRELVFELFFQNGTYWEAIHDIRARWNISAVRQLPPCGLGIPAPPPGWVHPKDYSSKEAKQNFESIRKWDFDLYAIWSRVVPQPYNDWGYYGLLWDEFVSVCVLYDPPGAGLLPFAARGGPDPHKRQESIPISPIMLPAVREQRDWIKSADAERYYYHEIIREVAKRLHERHGIDLWPIINDVVRDLGPELRGGLKEWEERENPFRWFIDLETTASRDDVVKAWRFARSRSKPGGRPPMDKLVAVQCAILYDDHNPRDPEDRRFKRWTHEKLAAEFRGYGVKDARSAEEHIKLGRELRNIHKN
jgi:hypothetical protein